MGSHRNNLVHAMCDFIEGGQATASVYDLIRATYPGFPISDGFLADILAVLPSVRAKVELLMEKQLIPLTQYYFDTYKLDTEPEGKGEAAKCVAGAYPGTGQMVGFKVATTDFVTYAWFEHLNKSAVGHAESHKTVTNRLTSQLGIEGPEKLVEEKLLQLTSSNGNEQ